MNLNKRTLGRLLGGVMLVWGWGLSPVEAQVIDFNRPSGEEQEAEPAKPEDSDKPKTEKAFVRLLNACVVELEDPWASGLDFFFKEIPLAVDLRMGEGGGYREIEFLAEDVLTVRRHGQTAVLAELPATLQAGTFNTFVVVGVLRERRSEVRILPLLDGAEAGPKAGTIRLLNVCPTPLTLDLGKQRGLRPIVGEWFQGSVTVGTTLVRLFFAQPDRENEILEVQQELIAGQGDAFTMIITQTPHAKPHIRARPRIFLVNETQARADAVRIPDPEAGSEEEVPPAATEVGNIESPSASTP